MVKIYFRIIFMFLLFCNNENHAQQVRLSDWMGDQANLIGNNPLNGIFIPGSHDSATYRLEQKFGKNQDLTSKLNVLRYFLVGFAVTKIAEKWAQAQNLTIHEQLLNGVRYLDLRVIYRDSKKDFYTVHSLYGPSLDEVLQQIVSFLQKHPREILIIQIGDLRYMPQGQKNHVNLIFKIKERLGKWLVPNNVDSLNKPIQELWDANQRVVLIYNKGDIADQSNLFSQRAIDSFWANADNLADLKTKLDNHLQGRDRSDKNLYVIQSQMTPTPETIKKGLRPFYKGYRSLKDMALAVDQRFGQWLVDWGNHKPSIIMTDFCNAKKSMAIISLNER